LILFLLKFSEIFEKIKIFLIILIKYEI